MEDPQPLALLLLIPIPLQRKLCNYLLFFYLAGQENQVVLSEEFTDDTHNSTNHSHNSTESMSVDQGYSNGNVFLARTLSFV